MTLVDKNNNMIHFPPVRDYKRLEDNDCGPNTGGMGCVIGSNNLLPFLSKDDVKESESINEKVINEIRNYSGILYGSYIKTEKGIKIIEYNCRFGDPECMLLMHILNTNFYTLCNSFISNNLNQLNIEFNQDSAICVYVNPKSYCRKNGSNSKYDLYFENNCENIYYSNIEINKDHKYSLSSRCLALIETDPNLYNCYRKVYNRLNDIHGNIYYRKDIGSNFLSKYEKYGVSIQNANKSLKEIKSNILSTTTKILLAILVPLVES